MSWRLKEHISRENLQLRENSKNYGSYCTDRNWLKYLYYDVEHVTNKDTRILEVGCGDGNSLIDICRESNISASNCVGTSLQSLPNHKLAREYGIRVVTGILAEELPTSWQKQFNITMTCAMLMHVDDLSRTVDELFRVTANKGYVLIYDLRQNIATAEFIAKQKGYKLIEPRYAVMKNMFGTIIQKQ